MVAAVTRLSSGSSSGPRPINLRKDIPQVLALLNVVFRASPDGEGRYTLNRTSLSQEPWPVLRLRQLRQGMTPGYVWVESGKIVGNVSVLTTDTRGRYLVANVAVHPDFRRQGIARTLIETIIERVREQGGHELLLQVRRDNEAAIRLYESIDFSDLGSMTSWYSSFSHFRLLPAATGAQSPDQVGDYFVRPLRRHEWRAAYRLDAASIDPDLNWPDPLRVDHYKIDLWRAVGNLISGRQVESWVAEGPDKWMAGVATITSEWGRLHTLTLRVHPRCHGEVEQPLLAKLLRRLQHTYRRNIRIDHPAEDEVTNQLLHRANFTPRRTLTTMRLQTADRTSGR